MSHYFDPPEEMDKSSLKAMYIREREVIGFPVDYYDRIKMYLKTELQKEYVSRLNCVRFMRRMGRSVEGLAMRLTRVEAILNLLGEKVEREPELLVPNVVKVWDDRTKTYLHVVNVRKDYKALEQSRGAFKEIGEQMERHSKNPNGNTQVV